MRHIQYVALDLFDEHGYDQVTVAQIAEAAEVGERSVYRYFGTKQMLVLYDEIDERSLELLAEGMSRLPLLEAVRQALRSAEPLFTPEAIADALRKLRHIDRSRELRAALAEYTLALGDTLGASIAAAGDLPRDDFACQIQGRCVATAVGAAIERWFRDGADKPIVHYLMNAVDYLDQSLRPATAGAY